MGDRLNESIQKKNVAKEMAATLTGEKNLEDTLGKSMNLNQSNIDPDKKNENSTISEELRQKYLQEPFDINNYKSLFVAPKFHPYLVIKNYKVEYMDPIIKKTKTRRFLCCC